MENVLKFGSLVGYQKGLDKHGRIRVFCVCLSDKHFMNSSPQMTKIILIQIRNGKVFEILEHLLYGNSYLMRR